MELFFHDVGLAGANRDFPKTVFRSVKIETVQQNLPNPLKQWVITEAERSSTTVLLPSEY